MDVQIHHKLKRILEKSTLILSSPVGKNWPKEFERLERMQYRRMAGLMNYPKHAKLEKTSLGKLRSPEEQLMFSMRAEAMFSGRELEDVFREHMSELDLFSFAGAGIAVLKGEARSEKMELGMAMRHDFGEDFFSKPVSFAEISKVAGEDMAMRLVALGRFLGLWDVEPVQGDSLESLTLKPR
jgi:hypothetical protein